MSAHASEPPPKAREGWITEHPSTGKPVEVVTREDYDWLFNWKLRAAHASEPQKAASLNAKLLRERARDQIGAIFLAPGERFSADHASQIDAIIEDAVANARTSENLMHRFHTDARFHHFVEQICYDTLQAYRERHGC